MLDGKKQRLKELQEKLRAKEGLLPGLTMKQAKAKKGKNGTK
jgi:ribosomal protein S6